MAKILLVEDDVSLAQGVKEFLFKAGAYIPEIANSGEDALQLLEKFGFDLIVLDWDLPGISGVNVLKKFRAAGGQTPVLFLTGRASIDSKLEGLDHGADDYLPKPFDLRELLARCQALLRRSRATTQLSDESRQLELVPDKRILIIGPNSVKLTKLEAAVLTFLMSKPGETFTSGDLLKHVYPSEKESSEEAVRSLIRALRVKLSNLQSPGDKPLIDTIPGAGYIYRGPGSSA